MGAVLESEEPDIQEKEGIGLLVGWFEDGYHSKEFGGMWTDGSTSKMGWGCGKLRKKGRRIVWKWRSDATRIPTMGERKQPALSRHTEAVSSGRARFP